jgi:hypothetical protein
MRKLVLSVLAGVTLYSSNAAANTVSQAFQAFYNNVTANGSGTCSAISGTFPVIANYNNTSTSSATYQVFQLKFLLSGTSLTPSPQYSSASLNNRNDIFRMYDPQLFGTTLGISGTYTGSITVVPIGSTGDELILQIGGGASAPVISTSDGCVISYYGTLYLSPE